MFCAFDGKPDIIRFYGKGEVHRPGDTAFAELAPLFGERNGVRSIITADIDRTSSSCGFAVPKMDFVEQRDTLTKWSRNKSDEDLAAYWAKKNAASIDGLPAVGPRLTQFAAGGVVIRMCSTTSRRTHVIRDHQGPERADA